MPYESKADSALHSWADPVLHVGSGYWTPGDGRLLTFAWDGSAWTLVQDLPCSPHPTHLDTSPDGRVLYVNTEAELASVSSYARQPSGLLRHLGETGTRERGGAYICSLGPIAAQVNYSSHTITVYAVDDAGKATEAVQVVPMGDGGCPHSIRPHPNGRWAYVANRSADTIVRLAVNNASARLTVSGAPFKVRAPASGPRHIEFHPCGRFLYCSDENSSTVSGYLVADTGDLTHMQTLPTAPPAASTGNKPADLSVHPSGRALYVLNRAHASVAFFTIDPASGVLSPAGYLPAGPGPRNCSVDPGGRFLAVGNLLGDTVLVYKLDLRSGQMISICARLKVVTPSGVLLAPTPTSGPAADRAAQLGGGR